MKAITFSRIPSRPSFFQKLMKFEETNVCVKLTSSCLTPLYLRKEINENVSHISAKKMDKTSCFLLIMSQIL